MTGFIMCNTREHWENIYNSKTDTQVSWHEQNPACSISLIKPLLTSRHNARLIDVGGGTSNLVAQLMTEGLISSGVVLDISKAAINRSRKKAGALANAIEWVVGDVRKLPKIQPCDVWHDRAVFHFLTQESDKEAYLGQVNNTLKVNGFLMIATFGVGGPEKCSGLPIQQYDETTMTNTLGDHFKLLENRRHQHTTPWGTPQLFHYFLFQKVA
jgi:ubiquinone/menaquinone biosynthesis C-methylase UbiE